jgi:asparagine synthase (glutamine-hydrolysing)
MCGLAGFLGMGEWNRNEVATPLLERMAQAIVSRGPDDAGTWHDECGIGLAHRRLSILDLSAAGHQPMVCHTGRYVIAFNGEIYNHLDLRKDLESKSGTITWRGHADTETLLAGFVAWGIEDTVKRCIGMFAFAVWDRETRVLTLARDRAGEKPLYYGWQGSGSGCFLFGSELKALKPHPAFVGEINRDALCLLMRHNYIGAPHSIYQGIHKLPPGSLLTVSLANLEPNITTYWSFADIALNGQNHSRHSTYSNPSPEESTQGLVDELEALLKDAVKQQMVADVPLGAFLSGGIDSSTIVALMQAQSSRPVKTFTIGFHEDGYNEAVHAKAVAKHLGTDHTELYVTPQEALDIIPKLPSLYCEPFADSSQIPTHLVSMLARQHVTVSLSGDAGDELFCGYNRYTLAGNLWSKISKVPRPARKLAASLIKTLPISAWDKVLGVMKPVLPRSFRLAHPGEKLHKAAGVLGSQQIDDLYLGLVSHWDPASLVLNATEPTTCLRGASLELPGLSPVQRMMASLTYLPDDILVKVDRAAMGISLETRVPLLDHRVIEFAWQIPQSLKLRDGVGKWILRQVLYRHVPQNLIERPKMGFGVPIDAWLRGPLKPWAEELLDEVRLKREGYFNASLVRQRWREHTSGQRNWQYLLWDVLMFQAWLEAEKTV